MSTRDAQRQKGQSNLRHDIQALRAVAVVVVILYHLWPDVVTGGYVGVDAFFAISGYLIAMHLLREIDSRNTVGLRRFWARRAQRLVPASSLVLVATSLGIWLWVPHSLWRQFFREIIASSLLFENWQLAGDAVDYLAASNSASPTQHFWTLSTEEQFYIGLPLLLVAAARAGSPSSTRRRVAIVLTLTTVASFGYSLILTASTPGVAYFSTFTRAWEFSLGALFALAPRQNHRNAPIAIAGLAAILLSVVTFNHETAMPGWIAAIPVLGTLAVLYGGTGTVIDRVGQIRPVALVGRVSYSAYLWHWPLLILAPYALGRDLGDLAKVIIGLLTIGIAWLSTTQVEDPIRFGRPGGLPRAPRSIAGWAFAVTVMVVGFATISLVVQLGRDRQLDQASAAVTNEDPPCLGAAAWDPDQQPCSNPELDGVLLPDPSVAVKDDANRVDCWGLGNVCAVGELNEPTLRLLAVGDSHNNALIGVYEALGEMNGWSIDVNGLGGCYLTTALQKQPSDADAAKCEEWRTSMLNRANSEGYDAILVTHSASDRPVVADNDEQRHERTVEGLVSMWRQLPDVPIIAIRDNPRTDPDVLTCIEQNRSDAATACALPRSEALSIDGHADAAAQVDNATVVDLSEFYCTDSICPPVIGNVVVYRDRTHLSKTYARTLIPYFNEAIAPVVRGEAPSAYSMPVVWETTNPLPVEPAFCGDAEATILGTSGDDTIEGTDGDDVIVALDGDDIIRAGDGNDIICGGDGNDWVKGGHGHDTIKGEDGNDQLFGELGRDEIHGGPGRDKVSGGSGKDLLRGGPANDRLVGNSGVDDMAGENGRDKLFGGPGDDALKGGGGKDWLYGGEGDDNLNGGGAEDACSEVGAGIAIRCEIRNI